jgi:NAD(P)-dependent dehydrogenase (short-subunit alcohol dehydrogenase family)
MSTIIITGASSGIGAIAARRLAERGHDIAVVGRNPQRTTALASEIGARAFLADYDSFASVRSLATELLAAYPTMHVLLNNAGGLVSPRGLSADGNEKTFQHNHLAPFLLTNLLRERLEKNGGRVVSTASVANRFGQIRLDDLQWQKRPWQGGWRAYGSSKLATILFIRELARRTELEAYSVHPGYVATAFGNDSRLIRLSMALRSGGFGIPAEQGAAPLVYLASEAEVPGGNGAYFDRFTPNGTTAKQAKDATLAAQLWQASADLVGLSSS